MRRVGQDWNDYQTTQTAHDRALGWSAPDADVIQFGVLYCDFSRAKALDLADTAYFDMERSL